VVPKPAGRRKPEHLRAARIPKNQLLDILFQCFRQYEYWPLKALRKRTDQPEAYLRETLDEIAVLNKSGRFTNLWSLKAHYREADDATTPAVQGPAPDEEDGSGDDEEMEDVVIQ